MALINHSRLIGIERERDVYVAREQAATVAATAGFDRFQCSAIETAVSELCTNVLRYGVRGWMWLRLQPDGLEAEVTDVGPGFGHAAGRRDGLGIGLAGVARLMDDARIENLPQGARVTAHKRLPNPTDAEESRWIVSVASQTRLGEVESGDTFFVADSDDMVTVAVVDGLGHGGGAATAAQAVVDQLATSLDSSLEQSIEAADRAAAGTRGAVGLLARIEAGIGGLGYSGLGDVNGTLFPDGERLVPFPGYLGSGGARPKARHLVWPDDGVLVLWTDGVRFDGAKPSLPIDRWVEETLSRCAVPHDDSLLLAVYGG